MNRRFCVAGAYANLAGVLLFAISMLTGPISLSYISSILIAWGFVLMTVGFYHYAPKSAKVPALCALAFGVMYGLCNSVVYFIQVTSVVHDGLSTQEARLLDFRQYGLIFSMDMLGYALMSVATFFAGFGIEAQSRSDRWLKVLLMIHGVFAAGCLVMPMLGLFSTGMSGNDWIGTAILEFWCAYFAPVGVLSIRYFSRQMDAYP